VQINVLHICKHEYANTFKIFANMIFTSSSTEASSITGLKGEPPPLLTPSIISATETKCVAWYQSSQGNVKESLHEKQKNRKKGKRVENNVPVGHKISIVTCNCSIGRNNMLKNNWRNTARYPAIFQLYISEL